LSNSLFKYAYGIACRRTRFRFLRHVCPEDYDQTIRLSTVLSPAKDRSLARTIDRELRRLGRDLGYFNQSGQEDNPSTPPCGCTGCERPGVYKDEVFGRLCRRHKAIIVQRRKRGWDEDRLYENLETVRRERDVAPIPQRNRKFWLAVRAHCSDSEWNLLWRWARGKETKPPTAILSRLRALLMEGEIK